jgi:molybdate transport system ATP-binding protein
MSGIEARFAMQLGTFALDAAFSAPERGVTALYGHSGSGKTSVLRCLAGLERAPQGWLRVNGTWWQDEEQNYFLPTHRRPIGYVFQEPSLFPHLSVRANLEYGRQRVAEHLRRVAFDQAVTLLGVSPLLDRSTAKLSGGERQRVAIARALLTSPRLLLMDEPLAALDARSKAEILPYLEKLHTEFSIPVIYVSHAPEEVARLADYLVFMQDGHVHAEGPLADLMTRLDLPLARSDTAEAVIEAVVGAHDAEFHLTYLDFPGGRITVPREDLAVGARTRLRVYARDVSLVLAPRHDCSILNVFPVRVTGLAEERPGQVIVRLDAAGVPLLARVTAKSVVQLDLVSGVQVYAQVKGMALLG